MRGASCSRDALLPDLAERTRRRIWEEKIADAAGRRSVPASLEREVDFLETKAVPHTVNACVTYPIWIHLSTGVYF